jgi:hyperosmotically inducible protein
LRPINHKPRRILVFASIVLNASLMLPTVAHAQEQTAPDNSATNKAHQNTADQQSEKSADKLITQKVRRSLLADKSLSTNAHNCKVITKNGTVTLKGPVDSETEKQAVAAKAADVVGTSEKVNNQLTVKQ